MIKDLILRLIDRKFGDNYQLKGEHVYLACPLAEKRHSSKRDTRYSFCISLTTCSFYCHSCELKGNGFGSLKKIIRIDGKVYLGAKDIFFKPPEKKNVEIHFPEIIAPITELKGSRGFRYILNRNPPYSKRDVYSLVEKFDLQFCYGHTEYEKENKFKNLTDYLIIPFECNGFKSFTARSTNWKEPRHFHPRGSNVGSLYLNFDNQNEDTIILVEGFFDLARMITYKYNNISMTFGKQISPQQKHLLLQKKPRLQNVIIMFDGEGIEEAKKLAKELCIFFNVAICYLKDGEEPDTITKFQADKYISDAMSRIIQGVK